MLYHPIEMSNKSFTYMLELEEISNLNIPLNFPIYVSRPTLHFPLSFYMSSFLLLLLFVFVLCDASTINTFASPVGQQITLAEFVQWKITTEDGRKVQSTPKDSKSSQPLLAPGCFTNSFLFWFLLFLFVLL